MMRKRLMKMMMARTRAWKRINIILAINNDILLFHSFSNLQHCNTSSYKNCENLQSYCLSNSGN